MSIELHSVSNGARGATHSQSRSASESRPCENEGGGRERAGDATESTSYGRRPTEFSVSEDELGDALFSLLALAEAVEVDAASALETSLEKYETRIAETGSPDSS